LVDRWCFDTEAGQTGGSSGEIARAFDALLGLTF